MQHHTATSQYPKVIPQANPAAHAQSAFYGELPAAAAVDAMARQVRAISARLMNLPPEAWTAIRDTENIRALSEAVSELRATVAAISGGDNADGATPTGICLVATMRDMLRDYRRRLQFVASNIPLSDPHSREVLKELLAHDRWMGTHLERCSSCRPPGRLPNG